MPNATRHGKHLIWAPSTHIGFQQVNPNYTPQAEQQHFTLQTVRFPDNNFRAVPPQERGEIMSFTNNSFGAATYSNVTFTPDRVTYNDTFNAPDDTSSGQLFSWQHPLEYVAPVPQALHFVPDAVGHYGSYQTYEATAQTYEYEGGYSDMSRQTMDNGLFVGGERVLRDEGINGGVY